MIANLNVVDDNDGQGRLVAVGKHLQKCTTSLAVVESDHRVRTTGRDRTGAIPSDVCI